MRIITYILIGSLFSSVYTVLGQVIDSDSIAKVFGHDSTIIEAYYEQRFFSNGNVKDEGWVIKRPYNKTHDELY